MSYVFISYSRQDSVYTRNLKRYLISQGFDVWVDEERIECGVNWWDAIVRALENSAAVIVVMTPASQASKWVQNEVSLVFRRKPILPLLLGGENWSVFDDNQIQYEDVRSGELPSDRFFEGLAHLVARKGHAANVTTLSGDASPSDGFEIDRAVAAVYRALERHNWKEALATLGQIRASDLVPADFPLDDLESQVRQKIGIEEQEFPILDWCPVPGGWTILSDASEMFAPLGMEMLSGTRGGKYTVPGFSISRHPVTNSQYNLFLAAPDGYCDERWWDFSPEALAWQRSNPLGRNFASPRPEGDLPRVFVSWYGAVAFCRWLTYKSGQFVTLPTEQQWQRAAQGDSDLLYPWGSDLQAGCCNYGRLIGKLTPVSAYPQGVSPYGVMDLCGNAWEWCLTEWGVDGANMLGAGPRVIRGGAWTSTEPDFLAVTFRTYNYPGGESEDVGFRCVTLTQS